ncbi:MAG: DUF493 domain-containing protein [Desulfuromonas sp.]|nr:MAG: DUF493 domain-containing protein [Desulfuromonas sp.]
MTSIPPLQLLDFPCDYEFKAFGPADQDGRFVEAVRSAVASVTPVSLDAMRSRLSSAGRYLCVTVVVRLHDINQLHRIYAGLRNIDGLKYLL